LFEYTTGSNANDDAPFDNKNSNTIMVDRVHKKWTGITTSNSSRTLWFDGPYPANHGFTNSKWDVRNWSEPVSNVKQ